MNTNIPASDDATTGSITVYQRISDGAKPSNVQLSRSVYKSTRGPDGATYRRTENTPLLTIPSGTATLSEACRLKLSSMGLSSRQLIHVNSRLAELAERALPYMLAAKISVAEAHIKTATALGSDMPATRMHVIKMLREALLVLDDSGVLGQPPCAPDSGNDSPQTSLLEVLKTFNSACEKAQGSYRQLPKGGDAPEELVLELQKAWFSSQDMFTTLKGRQCFRRPGGWSELRAQVLGGKVYRKGGTTQKAPNAGPEAP